ncbi:LamG-like jellyroll fold domain-containing protein [Kitasatospora sp. A2-31]|uniref:LamG-like jellyroll fold domain-containing protein n=1 Tax=Kitasatospora sp. A2-31 TaxID=2916414 RepID=UPI001EEAB145|nr:LamG-like jellyroll fold domain-containing protein [Kitasatospora sp. A2-31]MCG6498722.1 ricin-type beta-trefoil lectin domain protein [Kitasatospora sp. A2-31]
MSAAAIGLVLALTSVAPVAFAGPAFAAAAPGTLPPDLAAAMAAADAKHTKDKPPASAADRAIAQAKATGKPVPVPELTDEYSETVATPQGHLSRTQHPEQQRVRLQDGTWTALDAKLVADPTGGYRPKAAASGVRLSGGGSGPLGTLTSPGGETLAIDSPFPLTKPTLDEDGDGLVYPEVAPGIDLKVTADKFGGLSTVLIVKTTEAANNPQLKTVRFGTSGQGVTVQADATGNLTATGKDGTVRWHAPVPRMWDSSGSTATPTAAAAPVGKSVAAAQAASTDAGGQPQTGVPAKSDKASSADGPGIGARVAAMPTRATGNAIELTTDGSVLGKGQGPWFIDPGWIYDSRSGNAWTWTQQAYPTTPRYGQTTATNGQYARPGVGYQGFQTDKGIERSYFQIDTRGFSGAVINKATMSVWEYESSDFSCTTTYPVDLYLTGPIDDRTTWNNSPVTVGNRLGRAEVAGSGGPDCHDNVEFKYDVTSIYQERAATHDNLTFGLFAPDESNRMAFKRLDYRPVVVVEYDRAPEAPTNTYVWPPPTTASPWAENQGCDGSSVGWLGAGSDLHSAVSLNATVHSPVQNSLYSWSKIWDYSLPGAPVVDSGQSGLVGNGGNAAFQVRSDVIKDGHVYGWGAVATDGYTSSGYAPACRFGVDLTPPSLSVPDVYTTLPEAELADRFPPSGNGQVTKKKVWEWGTVPFTAVDTAPSGGTPSGVMCARWSWDPQLSGAQWQCGSSLPQGGVSVLPGRWGTNIVYLQVMDNARNVSPVAQYAFYVPWNPDGPPPVFGDVTGDGAPDIVTPDQAGDLRAYAVAGNPLAKSPAVSLVAKREDSPTGQGWGNIQFAHRGTLTGGNNIDDIVAHAPGSKDLWIYGNPGNTGYYGRVDSKTLLQKPKCVPTATEDCSWRAAAGYNAADWSTTLRVAALGDPVSTDLDYRLKFKNQSGLLTVESTDGGADAALWYYPTVSNNTLGKPVRLAAAGWKDKELISPGDWAKQGHPGLWTRNLEAAADGGKGALLARTFTTGTVTATDNSGRPVKDAGGNVVTVPTLTGISGASVIGSVSPDTWPVLGSDGDVTGKGSPGLWGKRGNGQIDIWWGEATDPGTANASFPWQAGPTPAADTAVNPLWYALDGTTAVDSNASNALYPNTFTRTTDHNGAAGKATALDGNTLYRTTNQPGIDASQSFTVAAWVKLGNTGGYQTVLSQAGNERSPFYLQYSPAYGKWVFNLASSDQLRPAAYYTAVDSEQPQVGAWTHLVGTYNAGTESATLYVNGRAAGSAKVPSSWKATGSLNIGGETTSRYPGPDARLNGAVGDVRVYPYAFTDQQANTLATAGSSVQIRSVFNSNKCLDNFGGTVGTPVALFNCWNGEAQHFTLTTDNKIKIAGADRCVATSDKPAGNGTKVSFQACANDDAQTWVRRYDGTLYNPVSDKCLELPGWADANGTALGVWSCTGNANQRWLVRAQVS